MLQSLLFVLRAQAGTIPFSLIAAPLAGTTRSRKSIVRRSQKNVEQRTMRRWNSALVLIAICWAALLLPSSAFAQRRAQTDPERFGFRFVGPVEGNRVASIAGVPGDASTYYAGAASGGVWK